MTNTFAFQGLIQFAIKRTGHMNTFRANPHQPLETVCVIENQRSWLGQWTHRLIASEAFPWTDATGRPISSFAVHPPPGFKWNGAWTIDVSLSKDSEGWLYGRDFKRGFSSSKPVAGRFVRTRRWIRPITHELPRTSKHILPVGFLRYIVISVPVLN